MELKEFIIKEDIKRKYILDASVIIKWYYFENESDLEIANYIHEKVTGDEIIIASPDLMIYEVLNFFIFKLKIPSGKIADILSELNDIIFIINTDISVQKKAFELSRKLKKPIYDSLYLALSQSLDCPLITADNKLKQDARRENYSVLLLSEFKSAY
ncbi:MAG: type II toxin-antitoxin system VapC family toxin [Actinobacteria bacterium]|nr:type II toxin-antitoxin system VapC family toxin [Actinomycetota bacterium]